jgi:hypothetical protein
MNTLREHITNMDTSHEDIWNHDRPWEADREEGFISRSEAQSDAISVLISRSCVAASAAARLLAADVRCWFCRFA